MKPTQQKINAIKTCRNIFARFLHRKCPFSLQVTWSLGRSHTRLEVIKVEFHFYTHYPIHIVIILSDLEKWTAGYETGLVTYRICCHVRRDSTKCYLEFQSYTCVPSWHHTHCLHITIPSLQLDRYSITIIIGVESKGEGGLGGALFGQLVEQSWLSLVLDRIQ